MYCESVSRLRATVWFFESASRFRATSLNFYECHQDISYIWTFLGGSRISVISGLFKGASKISAVSGLL